MFYAVAVGRKPGIYKTWDECKEQVHKYPNAKFKKFKNKEDALNFIGFKENKVVLLNELDLDIINNVEKINLKSELSIGYDIPSDHIIAFIDGSYNKNLETYGYGGVLLTNDYQYDFDGIGKGDEFAKMWNVSGELKAAIVAVEIAKKLNYKSLQLCYDYKGIEKWATNKWKAKKPATQLYKEYMNDQMKIIDISFKKIKAHSGVIQNEYADKLAGEAIKKRT